MKDFVLVLQDVSPFLDEAKLSLFAERLPSSRRERILSPTRVIDRARRAAAEYALKQAAQKLNIPYRTLVISYTPEGKPVIDSPVGLSVSFSHAGNLSCVALVRANAPMLLGVDIEQIGATPRYAALAERFFSPEMLGAYNEVEDKEKEQAFALLWTKLEAISKMDGKGVGHCAGKVNFPFAIYTTSYTTADSFGNRYYVSVGANQNIFPENESFPLNSLAIAKAICYNSGVNTRKE